MLSITQLILAMGYETILALADDTNSGMYNAEILTDALAAGEEAVRLALANAGYEAGIALPATLQDTALTIATERLFARRREMISDTWKQRADRAWRLLGEVSAGRHVVPGLSRTGRTLSTNPPDRPPVFRPRTLDAI